MRRIFTFLPAFGAVMLSASAATWTDIANEKQLSEAIANEAEAIRITADFTSSSNSGYRVYFPLQIDLNGHKVIFEDKAFSVLNEAEVVIDDLSETGGGEMVCSDNSLFFLNTIAPFLIKGGTYTTTGMANCFEVSKYREVTMEGGRINASRYGRALCNKGYFTMKGGTIVGADRGLEPVLNDIEGVFTMLDGAVYAGNMTLSRCFENTYWTDGDEEEIAVTVLPEGVTDGGAVVLNEKWAIPGTNYINYHVEPYTPMQPNVTHYYTGEETFSLPECDYRDNIPFAGWATTPDEDSDFLMEIKAGTHEDYQLYPIWKYIGLSEGVIPDLMPESVSPGPTEAVGELSEITLSFGEGDYYVAEDATNLGGLYNVMSGQLVSEVASIDTDWDGNAYVRLSETVVTNGTYQLRIPVNTLGNDDWFYSDMEEGRCNPDLFLTFKVYNAPQGETNCVTDPENGSTVESLSSIRFIFPDEEEVLKNYDVMAVISNQMGEMVAEVSAIDMDYDEELDNAMVLTLPEPITEEGVYTLSVPTGFFQFDWWERDCTAMTFTWTVSGNGGVGTTVSANGEENSIYDLYGRRVKSVGIDGLAPGIYIINGRKTVVR